jgi:hypothetical protein
LYCVISEPFFAFEFDRFLGLYGYFIFEISGYSFVGLGLLGPSHEAPSQFFDSELLILLRTLLFVKLLTNITYSFAGATACVCSPLQTLHLRQPLPIHLYLRMCHAMQKEPNMLTMHPYQMGRRLANTVIHPDSSPRAPPITGKLRSTLQALRITGKPKPVPKAY